MDETRLFRHLLATIAFRAEVALKDAPEDFGQFEAGNGVRKPVELVHHMTQILNRAVRAFGQDAPAGDTVLGWSEECALWEAALQRLDALYAAGGRPGTFSEEVLLQGPLSDCLTHIGQLVMLRRLHGRPTEPVSYMRVPIHFLTSSGLS